MSALRPVRTAGHRIFTATSSSQPHTVSESLEARESAAKTEKGMSVAEKAGAQNVVESTVDREVNVRQAALEAVSVAQAQEVQAAGHSDEAVFLGRKGL